MSNRILICDDQSYITRIVDLSLRKEGFETETCSNGLAAWESIQNDPPLLLVCDCEMPFMTGLELCREIRSLEHLKQLPIILLTARAFQVSGQVVDEDLNINSVIKKPFSPRELRRKVRAITDTLIAGNEPA